MVGSVLLPCKAFVETEADDLLMLLTWFDAHHQQTSCLALLLQYPRYCHTAKDRRLRGPGLPA